MQKKRIGFVSTRLAGTDGVSLETRKWAEVLSQDGHECYYMAGQLDTPPERSLLVPLCHFDNEEVLATTRGSFGCNRRDPAVTRRIEDIKHGLKDDLRRFMREFSLDVLIPENALSIPLNLPLGLALGEVAIEEGVPMVAHHHDFFWERKRFLHNCCWDYIDKAFPPHLSNIRHVCINSSQQHQLSRRRGVAATIVPNVMDYAHPPPPRDGFADSLRAELGVEPGEKFILQPTRIIQRKGIEHAIELVRRLRIKARLVISHASGDEGYEYYHRIRDYAELLGVPTVLCADNVGDRRSVRPDGRRVYELGDLYREADFVTYPSVKEGFGNAFLEAIYYRRPLMVNNYSIYFYDIRPRGFRTVEMDDFISEETVRTVQEILERPELAEEMAAHNYRLAQRYFSYDVLRQNLRVLLVDCFGSV